jgi:hypothetical protein
VASSAFEEINIEDFNNQRDINEVNEAINQQQVEIQP